MESTKKEIADLNKLLPRTVLGALLDANGMLTLTCDGFVVSIQCEFALRSGARIVEIGPATIARLIGNKVERISANLVRSDYPDLLLTFSNAELHAFAPYGGEELWFVDVPGHAWISP